MPVAVWLHYGWSPPADQIRLISHSAATGALHSPVAVLFLFQQIAMGRMNPWLFVFISIQLLTSNFKEI